MTGNITTIQDMAIILAPVFARNAVLRASIFGSWARGEQTGNSDLDFLVEFSDSASLLDLAALHEDILDMTGLDTDLLTVNSLRKEPKAFADNVLRDAKVIYEAN